MYVALISSVSSARRLDRLADVAIPMVLTSVNTDPRNKRRRDRDRTPRGRRAHQVIELRLPVHTARPDRGTDSQALNTFVVSLENDEDDQQRRSVRLNRAR